MPHLIDQPARDAIANDLDTTLVVEAAAGTGKTTELVKRILRILATGRAEVQRIVAVTFTEKAAGELKLRLRQALERERVSAGGEVRARLDTALTRLEEAHVNTIHGFCAELLRERPVEARVDPLFRVLTEGQAERLFGEAFSGWIQQQLAAPGEGVRRALRRSVFAGYNRTAADREDGPIDRLRRAAWDLSEWRDFTAPWTRPPFEREAAIDRLVEELHEFAALTEGPSYARDYLFLDTAPARDLSKEITIGAECREPRHSREDYDGWEARLVDLSRDRNFSKARHGRGPGYRTGVTRARVIEALDTLRANLDRFRLDADADLAALLQQELAGAVTRYEELKRRSGALDFLDLLLKARDLLKGTAIVRRGFQQRFTHIFVDEFQDTDPLQAEILLLLAASDPEATDWRGVTPIPGRLFIVGDPKQSIYRFRRADVGIYREVCERLLAGGARGVKLETSFRSVPQIQACINAAFAPVMTGDAFTLQADYVPLLASRGELRSQPSVVVLPVPEPYGQRNVSAICIERSLPDAVGAFVDWILGESKWKVTERSGDEPVAVQSRHICILFRRFLSFGDDVTEPYVRALEARGIHHVLVGGKTFHDREEVETMRAALAAIEWPDDQLSIFATLRGALFAIGDEELLDWRHRWGAFHPFRVPPEAQGPIVDALRVLKRLHQRRNYVPVADTIQQLLHETRAHVGFVLRPAGEQALANVLHIAELARQYEAGGGISFRGFVDELRVAADAAQAGEAPILEEGSDGVRLMTVHKAKGLEFPIVILADLTCRLSRPDAGRWIDREHGMCALRLGGWSPIDLILRGGEEAARDEAEAKRLAYVAATRARDVLVVPAVGDGSYEGGWLDPLMPAIYPPEQARRDSRRAPGCAAFTSKDTVMNRPEGDPARPHTVAPGLHAFDGYSAVWWDPHVLHLGAVSSFGLRRDDLIVKDGDPATRAGSSRAQSGADMFAVDDRMADYERWRESRRRTVDAARTPSIRVDTATAWAAEAAQSGVDSEIAGAADIRIVEIPEAAFAEASAPGAAFAEASAPQVGRPRGARFGTLVHAVLATVPLDATDTIVRRTAETQGRILAAPPEETAAAAAVVEAVLRHDLMARARASAAVRRETPLSWMQQDGTLVEGVLDLAFDEGDQTIVVDFKTDHELSAGVMRYRAQLQQYVSAVSAVTRRRAYGVLFRI